MTSELQRAYDAFQAGRFDIAETASRHVLAQAPAHPFALMLLGLALAARGLADDALGPLSQLVRLQPGDPNHWINFGNALRSAQKPAEALAAYRRAAELGADDAPFHLSVGALALEIGDHSGALRHLERGHVQDPSDPELRLQLARCLVESNETDRVLGLLRGWRDLTIADTAVLNDIGLVMLELGELAEAEAVFQAVRERDPQHPDVLANFALLYERANRLDEARQAIAELDAAAGPATSGSASAQLARAKLAAREGRLEDARTAYTELIEQLPTPARRHKLNFELGKALDRLGDTDAAYAVFEAAQQGKLDHLRQTRPDLFDGRDPLAALDERVSAVEYAAWPARSAPDAEHSPIFVVGYPRSGTTLLEQILDAHPALCAMDERPIAQAILAWLDAHGLVYPRDLGKLDDAALEALREVYWSEVHRHVQPASGQRVVDKNPLNLVRLPLFARLFPNARYILALRDPRDACLSCFMQSFRAPTFAVSNASLEASASMYARVMDFWLDQSQVFAPVHLALRYEDLIEDLPGKARELIEFLGLSWDARVLDYSSHAKARGFISTPSYAQVVEPIYRRSLGRWRRYARHFDRAGAILAPWLRHWGYPG